MKIKLESKFFNYNISIEKDFNSLIKYIKNNYSSGIRIGIITDSNVGRIYLKEIKDNLKKYQIFTYTIIAGEKSKNIETYIDIQKFLIDNNFKRKDILISLGGGVVGDITGFCASTYMRGISFIQVPTSLLSQVDSSIGGKTAINFMALKNIIGSFYSPDYVYINLETLKTLENKELFSGYSEIIKTFLIGNIDSNDIFNFNYSIYNIDKYIFTSLLIKKRFVEKDYTDVGERLYLNFGHTFGHAIEAEYCEFLSHGECVAIGMLLAIRLSYNRGMITDQTYKRISVLINNLIFINKEIIDISRVFPNLKYDKKNFGKQKWILLKGISNPCIVTDVEEDEIIEAFKQINWCCNK